MTRPAPPEIATAPAAAAEPAAARALPPKPRSGKTAIVLLGSAAVFAVLALVGYAVSHWRKTPDASRCRQRAPVSAQLVDNGAAMDGKMDALIDAAKKAGRRDTEIAQLTTAKGKIADAAKSGGAPLSAVQQMSGDEIEILGRAEKRLWRDVDGDGKIVTGDAVVKLQQAKSALDAALATSPAQDAGKIVDATRLAVLSFGAFQDAYTTATPLYALPPSRRRIRDPAHGGDGGGREGRGAGGGGQAVAAGVARAQGCLQAPAG